MSIMIPHRANRDLTVWHGTSLQHLPHIQVHVSLTLLSIYCRMTIGGSAPNPHLDLKSYATLPDPFCIDTESQLPPIFLSAGYGVFRPLCPSLPSF